MLSIPRKYLDVIARSACPSCRWITISEIPSRDISTACAWRSWCLCRRRHKHQYADLIVMPTRSGEVLQSANSGVRNIGIIPLHFEARWAAAANTVCRDRLDVRLPARDAVNSRRGSAFATWTVGRPDRHGGVPQEPSSADAERET